MSVEPSAGKDRLRGTGGNLFIDPEATTADLLRSINDQLGDIREYAHETGRVFDIAEVTISTRRIKSGRISVTVTADLAAQNIAQRPTCAYCRSTRCPGAALGSDRLDCKRQDGDVR